MNWDEIWQGVLSAAVEFVTSFGLRILASIVLLIVGFKVIGKVCRRLKKSKGIEKLDHSVSAFIVSMTSFILKILLILTVCAILGIPMTSFSAIIAAAGLAVGLALQGSLSNFAGGVLILIFRPFSVDDFISSEEMPVNEDIFARGLCLPSDVKMTAEEQEFVIAAIREMF